MASQDKLQRKLGYAFADNDLINLALTHRSHGPANNERLEFLGDAILNFIIAEALYRRFDDASEGQLSRLRARLVKRRTLAEIARELDVGDCLIMGPGELKSGGFERDSILSDALEAIIGAMYIDSGIVETSDVVLGWFYSRLDELSPKKSHKDAKSRLQEFLQARQAELPEYVVTNIEGKAHDQTFYVECRSELLDSPAKGSGGSIRIAEQNAAVIALVKLGVDHEHDHG